MISIGIRPEYIMSIYGFAMTNSYLTTILVSLLLVLAASLFYVSQAGDHLFVKLVRIFVFEILKFIDSITHDRELSKKVLPLIATLFAFILTANLLALVPGFLGAFFISESNGNIPLLRSPNSDLTTTMALAVFSVAAVQFYALRMLGTRKYLSHFFSLKSFTSFVLGFFELISEGVRVLSFSFRLFGNIFAGEILILIMGFLVPYIIPIPFMIMEVFVGIIQAFIFSMLTLAFIKIDIMRNESRV